jgi:hypothetical protein
MIPVDVSVLDAGFRFIKANMPVQVLSLRKRLSAWTANIE